MLTRCMPLASLPFKGQVTEQATVKWSIVASIALIDYSIRECAASLTDLARNVKQKYIYSIVMKKVSLVSRICHDHMPGFLQICNQ